jgi:hypothetical protein
VGDTSLAGIHYGEFKVTYQNNTTETFPNGEVFRINVTAA